MNDQIIPFLQALNTELQHLQPDSRYYLSVFDINSPQLNNLLHLQNREPTFHASQDSIFTNLHHLKTLIHNLGSHQSYTPRCFVKRRLISYEISRIGLLIQKEIQLCLDREDVCNLVKLLQESCNEEEILRGLDHFEARISTGFDPELQNFILKERLFHVFEAVHCDGSRTPTVREKAGRVISSLVLFNRNVFVGYLLMGLTVPTLVSMGSCESLEILISLVESCKGHLVNEMELHDEIPKIIGLLSSEDLQVKVMAMHCLIDMSYFGRKEVINSMIDGGLVEKLVLLQRVEPENDSREVDDESGREKVVSLSNSPFTGCIARFAVQVEVGEGMVKGDKKETKLEIMRRARAACVSEAEAAAVVAEILWGSHP